jgi:hypothetical protein
MTWVRDQLAAQVNSDIDESRAMARELARAEHRV